MSKHLWEVEHRYYCNEGNYFDNSTVARHESWADFVEENGDPDPDYNLLFRWDWDEVDGETMAPTFNGDPYYRNGKLKLFWMGQRKGLYRCSIIKVCRADEPQVIAFLKPRLAHLLSLWGPLATP